MPDHSPFETPFAHSVVDAKYMRPHGETHWNQLAQRVVRHPMAALGAYSGRGYQSESEALLSLVQARQFMPGGRYLYAAGNDMHQVQNCLLLACEDTREGWGSLAWKVEMSLLTGAGIGVYYGRVRGSGSKVARTGGTASGPVPKMIAVNEQGRAAVQGGDRRSAIWAGLPWSHSDVLWFNRAKDWPAYIREAKALDPSVTAPLDMTNVSVCLDDEFFEAFENSHFVGPIYDAQGTPQIAAPDGGTWHAWAHKVYWDSIDRMTQSGEPGFSVDLGEQADEKLRNAPVAGPTRVLTAQGYKHVNDIVGEAVNVWTGKQWARNVVFSESPMPKAVLEVMLTGGRKIVCDPKHPFMVSGRRVAADELAVGQPIDVSLPRPELSGSLNKGAYTLGWLYGDGCFSEGYGDLTLCSDESKACREWLVGPVSETVVDKRGFHRMYYGAGFKEYCKERVCDEAFSWPPEEIVAFVAGLFDADGNYEPTQQRIRLGSSRRPFLDDIARLLEQVGVLSHVSLAGRSSLGKSQGYQLVVTADYHDLFVDLVPCKRVRLAKRRTKPYRKSLVKVISIRALPSEPVFCADVGVPEHSFVAEGVLVGNCTEIVSADDSDICNLGGVVLSRFDNIREFEEAVRLGVLFLTAGTVYSDVPYGRVAEVRDKNRRLGLDILGVHEFLLKRGLKYGTDDAFEALEPYMAAYGRALEYAHEWQHAAGLSLSVAATSGAPTGTRGIAAETTTGWEPVTYAAYKRSVITSKAHEADSREEHYVVDPTVARLLREGYILPNEDVEDSASLAYDYERRFKMQAYAQSHTDQAISMTINLPHVMTDLRERRQFGETLYRYLPRLRGITIYPDGAIAGQPITRVPLAEALGHDYDVVEEEEKCAAGACGI